MRMSPLTYTCERRGEYITDGEACAQAFVHCCKVMEIQRAESQEENLQLARSKGPDKERDGLRWMFGVFNNTLLW